MIRAKAMIPRTMNTVQSMRSAFPLDRPSTPASTAADTRGLTRTSIGQVKRHAILNDEEEALMGGTTDDMKGRAKEALGDLTDDDDLKREGKADRAAGAVKDKAEDAEDWVSDKVDDVKERLDKD
jgi:uncharacterized protein YjbJ (UPF0337 family)